jgi:hypothetical protein
MREGPRLTPTHLARRRGSATCPRTCEVGRRLRKIERITGRDPTDHRYALALHLACLASPQLGRGALPPPPM